METNWFKKAGRLYRPAWLSGWLVTLLTLVLCVWVFIAIGRKSQSVSDTLICIFCLRRLVSLLGGLGCLPHQREAMNFVRGTFFVKSSLTLGSIVRPVQLSS
ncbi:MAG: hypothetical protein H7Z75_16535 [Ferruginibacter sp.]|nr:hypothetical protein [Cytophagales bacterium]